MKLLQANIWGGRLQNQLAEIVSAQNVDFLCLQEAVSTKGDALIFATIEDIGKEAGFDYVFFSPVFDFNLMQKKAGFGNAILSKYPIKDKKTVFTRLEHRDDFDFDLHDYNIRNFQHAVVEVEGKQLHLLNHHGHHVPEHKNGDEETMRQCKIIADYAESLDGPVLLTGDFNLSPNSESLEQINKVLDNLSALFKLETTRTPLTHKTEVCDYIFASKDIRVKSFEALDEIFSDHKGLVLEFEI